MRYQALLNTLKTIGYTFRAQYGQLQSITSDPPLVKILHRYPGRKTHTIQASKGYVTRMSLPGQLPEETMLYWCTHRTQEGKLVSYSGSDWSQLRHIVSCKRASTE